MLEKFDRSKPDFAPIAPMVFQANAEAVLMVVSGLTALEGIRKLDIGGREVCYTGQDHSGLDLADLSITGTDGKFKR